MMVMVRRGLLRRWETWVVAAGILIGALLIYLMISGLMTPDLVPATTNAKIEVTGISGQGLHDGRTSWRFSAAKSEFSIDGTVSTYHDAAATYYLRGKPTYKIAAGEITVDSRSMNYNASKGVRVWSLGLPDKQHFVTDALVWNTAAQTLTCPGPTDLSYHGVAIRTDHLSANLATGMITTGKSVAKVGAGGPAPTSTNR
jgi:hypothetical protein